MILEYHPKFENAYQGGDTAIPINKNQEFIGLNNLIKKSNKDLTINIFANTKNSGFAIVYDDGSSYIMKDLKANENFEEKYVIHASVNTKVYIWNPRKLNGTITLKVATCE